MSCSSCLFKRLIPAGAVAITTNQATEANKRERRAIRHAAANQVTKATACTPRATRMILRGIAPLSLSILSCGSHVFDNVGPFAVAVIKNNSHFPHLAPFWCGVDE